MAAGDTIVVDLLEQGGERVRLVVAGTYDPMVGQGIYMSRASAQPRCCASRTWHPVPICRSPRAARRDVLSRLKAFPGIAGVVSRPATIRNIDEQMRQSMVFVLALIITSACIIALGVVYNSARIALSERGRELASLRVLGFTTGEVSRMLLGEQGAVMLVALPLGIAFGAAFSFALVLRIQDRTISIPVRSGVAESTVGGGGRVGSRRARGPRRSPASRPTGHGRGVANPRMTESRRMLCDFQKRR